ncbi:MAG: zf-HC2 domain-containing protein [Bryobacteraceae bacterium]|nr:zf-HC2 domain-containing protein [Bryobacteraceae bacterium]
MLTCKEFLNGLNDYLDDTADPELKSHLHKHVNECPNCWVIVDTTKKTLQVFKGAEPQAIPPDVHDRLMKALEKKVAASKRAVSSPNPPPA